jgi:hypothetical protein
MINDKFIEVFELSKKLQEKNYKKDYKKLSKIDKSIGTFEEYVKREKEELNREIPTEKKKIVEDAYVSKDTIRKENLTFDLYLFRLKHIEPIEFDEDYKIKPLKETPIYEYGAVVSLEDEKGYYSISGIFGGVETNDHIAQDKYNVLKTKIENNSEEDLLDELKNDILKQINK